MDLNKCRTPSKLPAGRQNMGKSRKPASMFYLIGLTGILVILFGFQINSYGNLPPPPAIDISVDPLTIDFCNVDINSSSEWTVTVSNEGENAELTIGTITGTDTPFSIENDYCSNQTIVPGGNCTLEVWFSPAATGSFNDTFDIPSDDPDKEIVIVCLTGSGMIAGNNPPAKPELVYPSNGSTDMPTTLTLEWGESTDSDGDTVTYKVYIGTDQELTCVEPMMVSSVSNSASYTFASVYPTGIIALFGIVTIGGLSRKREKIGFFIMIVMFAGGLLLSSCGNGGGGNGDDTTSITYTVSGLSSNTQYYWAVVAEDSRGGETSSSVGSFTTR